MRHLAQNFKKKFPGKVYVENDMGTKEEVKPNFRTPPR
jgi:hypothetical protein